MTYQLRPYQSDLLDRINKSFETNRSILAQLPTGSGKTIVFSTVVNEAIQKGLKCLVLAHREELILQAVEKLEVTTNFPVGIIKAGYPTNYNRDIQVASIQSLTRRLHHKKIAGSLGATSLQSVEERRLVRIYSPTAF